jgi:hypothetical protein
MLLLAGIIGNRKVPEDRASTTDKEELPVKMWTKLRSFKIWTVQIYAETIQWAFRPWTLREATTMTQGLDKRGMHLRTKWGNQPHTVLTDSFSKTKTDNFNWVIKLIQLEERKDRTNLISTRCIWTTCQTKVQEPFPSNKCHKTIKSNPWVRMVIWESLRKREIKEEAQEVNNSRTSWWKIDKIC